MLLGLTGGYCSGKNLAARLLEKRGFTCFDIDRIGREAQETPESLSALSGRFGPGILDSRGGLDRRALGAVVFSDPEALAWVERLVHPATELLFRPRLAAARDEGKDIVINAALLFRMPEAFLCRAILEIRAPVAVRIRRGIERDGLSAEAVRERIRRQKGLWDRRAEYGGLYLRVRNDSDEAALSRRLDKALARIRSEAREERLPSR